MHQSLHHLAAGAHWNDGQFLDKVRNCTLTGTKVNGLMNARIVDDTGFPEKGRLSGVRVTCQHFGQVVKQDMCRMAASSSVRPNSASVPIALRLYLPERQASKTEPREQAGVPETIRFQTKPEIALDQIRQAVEQKVARAPVLANAGYGVDSESCAGITASGLPSRPARLLGRGKARQPLPTRELTLSLPPSDWMTIRWRDALNGPVSGIKAGTLIEAEPHPERIIEGDYVKLKPE